ncbi:hypothetical protein H5410_007655 [Solanum commersonii]|uniref:Uncharacterized protein n=1 Tax=Solanum commersonii TaxID=4109 RepID=A0A9J6ACQ1_SOLCO|nr:hypothetical protein H5410_007655 [Solanum commersonii]
MYNEFLRKQEEDKYAFESVTQELESLRSDLGELNLWIGDKKSGMCLEDWEEKGRRSEGYLLMIQYRLQHLMAQNKRSSLMLFVSLSHATASLHVIGKNI